MKIRYIFLGLIIVISSFLTGCNQEQEQQENKSNVDSGNAIVEENEKIKIFTTLYPLEDFTKKIGGEFVDVETIIPPGSDAHTYEPTSKEMVNIAESDAFIYNGLGMETFSDEIVDALKNEKTLMVKASTNIETIGNEHIHEGESNHKTDEQVQHEDHGHEKEQHAEDNHQEVDDHGHEHSEIDPHVWLDPYGSIILAENIKNALVELKPEAKDQFENNFEALVLELKELDHEFHQLVSTKNQLEIIVSHAAFGYWEKSYGIDQIAVSGLSPTNEPSQKDLEKIIDIATEKNIKYVIFEQNITPKVAEVIRNEINAEALRLHNLAILTEEDIKNNEDYFSLMRKNIETLNKALK